MALNKKSQNVLKYIYKHPYTKSLILSCVPIRGIDRDSFDDILHDLVELKYVSCRVANSKEADTDKIELEYTSPDAYLVCLPDGEAEVEQNIKLKGDVHITRLIAIITIIISIISMVVVPFMEAYFSH